MLVAVEGVSAAGKSSWASRFLPAVVGEICFPQPAGDFATVGRFWTEQHVLRWRRGEELEARCGTAVFDTDPMKQHYAWCKWRIGDAGPGEWDATVAATRAAVAARRLGFADRIVFLDPDVETVRRQKITDPTRRRSNFEQHLRFGPALREWYGILDELDPGRVVWRGLDVQPLEPKPARADRFSLELFDAFAAAARLRGMQCDD